MCDIIKDANGSVIFHEHKIKHQYNEQEEHIIFYFPDLPIDEDWKNLKKHFPGKKLYYLVEQ
jgi:hypothetical protein